jgi:hypothetical protein
MAIALAVSKLSPVTILILIPADWHILADERISSLSGSIRAKIPIIVISFSRISLFSSF